LGANLSENFIITKNQAKQIIAQAQGGDPREICGLMGGKDGRVERLFPATNADESNLTYMVEPKEQFKIMKAIRDNNMELVGIYHSHPASEAYPSPTDCRLAFYEQAHYVIVSLRDSEPVIRAYKINDGKIIESILKIVDD